MANNKEAWWRTMEEKHGSKQAVIDFMKSNGSKGGKLGGGQTFKKDRELASRAGKKAGVKSIKGHKLISDSDGIYTYIVKATGKVVKYKYDGQGKKTERIA